MIENIGIILSTASVWWILELVKRGTRARKCSTEEVKHWIEEFLQYEIDSFTLQRLINNRRWLFKRMLKKKRSWTIDSPKSHFRYLQLQHIYNTKNRSNSSYGNVLLSGIRSDHPLKTNLASIEDANKCREYPADFPGFFIIEESGKLVGEVRVCYSESGETVFIKLKPLSEQPSSLLYINLSAFLPETFRTLFHDVKTIAVFLDTNQKLMNEHLFLENSYKFIGKWFHQNSEGWYKALCFLYSKGLEEIYDGIYTEADVEELLSAVRDANDDDSEEGWT